MGIDTMVVLSRIIPGAICAFFSILLWSKTREPAWIFIIIGTIFMYTEIVFSTLEAFGIISSTNLSFNGIPLIKLILINLPVVFITIGFIIAAVHHKK